MPESSVRQRRPFLMQRHARKSTGTDRLYVVDLRHPLQAPCGGYDLGRGDTRRHISSRRGRGNVGIPEGFPQSVGRVGSRLYGFPCFPTLRHFHGLLFARKCSINRCTANPAQCAASATRRLPYSSVVNECIGDLTQTENRTVTCPNGVDRKSILLDRIAKVRRSGAHQAASTLQAFFGIATRELDGSASVPSLRASPPRLRLFPAQA
jgi:hypothetical protein